MLVEFDPFPPGLLAAVAAVPSPPEYGLEAVPLLRWLMAQCGLAGAAMVDDGRGLAAPAAARAVPPGGAFAAVPPGAVLPAGTGLVHVAAELPPDALSAEVASLRVQLPPGGLIVVTAPGHAVLEGLEGAVSLAIGDGVVVVPAGPPALPLRWLAAQTPEARGAVAQLFDMLGRQITTAADLHGRAQRQQALVLRERRHARAQQDRLRDAQTRIEELEDELAAANRDLHAILGSTSWKLTRPLRDAIERISRRPKAIPPEKTNLKAHFKRMAEQDLWDFLVSAERIRLPSSPAPDVSILLVLYNQAAFTRLCLQSIVDTIPRSDAVEVVIVDNASSDDTGLLLERVEGARVIRNTENVHFLHGVNQAAAAARGRDILLLNNDAVLRPGALQAARRTLHARPGTGAVGGKLVLVDGTVQEAGSIVWQDGTCVGYGRGGAPEAPEFQFRRAVDFCSGAFLLVQGGLFRVLGGLDTAFAPAYYEEVDLCMRLWGAGHAVVYEPEVEVLHYEFGSSSSSEAAFALQRRNHGLFAERHAAALRDHLPAGSPPLLGRMRPGPPRLLSIEDRVPYPELGAGYPRAARLLNELVAEGWFVTLYPVHEPEDEFDSAYATFPREIEFMLDHGEAELEAFLAERDGYYDAIIVSRPHNMRRFLKVRGTTHARAKLIYDAEAMFAGREFLRLQQAGTPASPELRRNTLKEEIGLTETADIITAVNRHEAEIFRGGGHKDVRVLGLGVQPAPVAAGFAGRRDFLFVGSLDFNESPNADAVLWFVDQVWPLVTAALGEAPRLLIAGRCVAPRVLALRSERIQVLGLVDELTPLYAAARVFVAPHRFAAGLPLKVQEAVSRGLPVVASELLARQLGWTPGTELLAATTAEDFAASCVRLYQDRALWHALRRAGIDRLTAETRADEFSAVLRSILAECKPTA